MWINKQIMEIAITEKDKKKTCMTANGVRKVFIKLTEM